MQDCLADQSFLQISSQLRDRGAARVVKPEGKAGENQSEKRGNCPRKSIDTHRAACYNALR